ncbi:MAG: hypothetical protein CVV48_07995 [Spirochaetae bacterium HGW-Spirochaetae-4]|jgi:DNA replication protein DnaC|nr:MAG: hypothetical protein CVV48_07995 [Spirochaetae bacterium HGW-Spirochaetae-4]
MRKDEERLALNFEKLGATGISLALIEAFSSPAKQHVPLLDILLDATGEELEQRRTSRASRLLKRVKLHNTVANLDELEYHPQRNLDRVTIERLATCEYLRTHSNVIVISAAGTGKTFLSRALAHRACEHGYRTKVVSFPAMMRELAHLVQDRYTEVREADALLQQVFAVGDRRMALPATRETMDLDHSGTDGNPVRRDFNHHQHAASNRELADGNWKCGLG